MKFSDKLRNLRIQRGMTQMELARGTGTSQSAVTAWENGKREPDFRTIERLAAFFCVPFTDLLPSTDGIDASYANTIAETFGRNAKLRELFELAKYFGDDKLDTLLAVARTISSAK